MALTIKRYGGMLARPPKTRTVPLADLDAPARDALTDLLASAPEAQSAMPDGFVYTFEVDEGEERHQPVAVAGPSVPERLRKLLP